MKIEVKKIPIEGLRIIENIEPKSLDLETELVKFQGPVKIEAHIYKITNAVTVDMNLSGVALVDCSRCLEEVKCNINKKLNLSYPVDPGQLILDLSDDIREEIMLDYSLQPLCKPACKGLCFKCGKNLNDGGCSCGTT